MRRSVRESMSASVFRHWCTGPELVRLLHRFGRVELDPCSNRWSTVNARVELSRGGLHATSWLHRAPGLAKHGHFAYVNSPYGNELGNWAARCVLERQVSGIEILQLAPARVDTRWWRKTTEASASNGFWRGRLRFWKRGKPGDGAFFPSALIYYGDRADEFEAVFSEVADCYRLHAPLRNRALSGAPSPLRLDPPPTSRRGAPLLRLQEQDPIELSYLTLG